LCLSYPRIILTTSISYLQHIPPRHGLGVSPSIRISMILTCPRLPCPPTLHHLLPLPLHGPRLRSPIVTHQDLPLRIDTEPPPQERTVRWIRPRPQEPLRQLSEEHETSPPEGAPAPAAVHRAPQPAPAIPVSSAEPTQPAAGATRDGPDIDFEQQVRNLRGPRF
jgi:hypothetical protein